MLAKLLRCKKGKVWIPDGYLTNIVGFCDRGRFVITKTFTLPCKSGLISIVFLTVISLSPLSRAIYASFHRLKEGGVLLRNAKIKIV